MPSKSCVCVHVTSGLDQLELALLSEDNTQIQHVASINCTLFDAASRRLQQPDSVTDAIKQLFVAAKIPMGSLPTVLILPSYFSKNLTLTSNLGSDDITMVLLGEVESHYIFKNHDAAVDWVKLADNQVLYSAYIKEDIEAWIAAFQELRIPLVVIDTGFFALIRGLMATGALQSVMEHNRPWMLTVVTETSCQLALLQGYQLKQAEEIPLGTEDTELAVQDVTHDIARMLENQVIDHLTLVNNTMRINLDVIKDTLNLDVPTIDIVQNRYTVQSLGSSQDVAQYPCTLEALGGVLTHQFHYLPQLNFAPKQGRSLLEADTARQNCLRWLIVSNVAMAILCGVLWASLQGLLFFKNQQLQSLAPSNPTATVGGIPPAHQAGIPPIAHLGLMDESSTYKKLLVKTLYQRNMWVNNLMVAVGKDLPEKAWIQNMEFKDVPVEAKTSLLLAGGVIDSADPMNDFQQKLVTLFNQQAPSLLSLDPDATQQSTYQWKMGLHLDDSTKPADTPAG